MDLTALRILIIAFLLFVFTDFLRSKFSLDLSRLVIVTYSCLLVFVFSETALLLWGTCALVLSEIDRREYRIPDAITKPALFALSIWHAQSFGVILFAWTWIALMYGLTIIAPHLIGRGDIKLIACLILLNEATTYIAPEAFLGYLLSLASLLALPEALLRQRSRRLHPFPFGPALSAASLLIFGFSA